MNEKKALMRIIGFLDQSEKYFEYQKVYRIMEVVKQIRINIEEIIEEEGCEL